MASVGISQGADPVSVEKSLVRGDDAARTDKRLANSEFGFAKEKAAVSCAKSVVVAIAALRILMLAR